MKFNKFLITTVTTIAIVSSLCGCSATEQTPSNKQMAGAGIGAVGGYVAATLLHAPTAIKILLAAGGAYLGYNIPGVETQSQPIKEAGGQVYQVGDYVTIVIPSAVLFEAGKANLSLQADQYLEAAAEIIAKYPTENVLVTSNTAGLFSKAYDLALSEKQAEVIAAGLWSHGVNSNDGQRKVNYSGLGDMKPVANDTYAKGIDNNRRIQITLYPSKVTDRKDFSNIEQIGAK